MLSGFSTSGLYYGWGIFRLQVTAKLKARGFVIILTDIVSQCATASLRNSRCPMDWYYFEGFSPSRRKVPLRLEHFELHNVKMHILIITLSAFHFASCPSVTVTLGQAFDALNHNVFIRSARHRDEAVSRRGFIAIWKIGATDRITKFYWGIIAIEKKMQELHLPIISERLYCPILSPLNS